MGYSDHSRNARFFQRNKKQYCVILPKNVFIWRSNDGQRSCSVLLEASKRKAELGCIFTGRCQEGGRNRLRRRRRRGRRRRQTVVSIFLRKESIYWRILYLVWSLYFRLVSEWTWSCHPWCSCILLPCCFH